MSFFSVVATTMLFVGLSAIGVERLPGMQGRGCKTICVGAVALGLAIIVRDAHILSVIPHLIHS